MSLFRAYLDQIKAADSKALREAAVEAAIDEISGVASNEKWDEYAEYGDWVNDIPQLIFTDKKKAKKYLKTLIDIIARKNKASRDTAEKLIRRIKRCHSIEELNELEAGEVEYHPGQEDADGNKKVFNISLPLQDRIQDLYLNKDVAPDVILLIEDELAKQRKYLERKKLADKIAWPLTIVLCLLAIGVVGALVIFAALPAIGIAGLVIGAGIIGYVEIPVFYGYVKRSLRNLFVRGVFQSIDNNLLNQAADEMSLKDRHALTDAQKNAVLNTGAGWWWRRIKYALTSLGGLLAIAATIGFSALSYMQVLEALPLLGITAGAATVILPAFIAIISALYFFVMFDNIFQAIKKNIFKQIWHQMKEMWQKSSGKECAIKCVVAALVLLIAVVATIFTAGAWLQSSADFFTRAFGIADFIAEKIGLVIGGIQLVTTFGFNVENCFKTVGRLGDLIKGAKGKVVAYINEAKEKVEAQSSVPKKVGLVAWYILKPLIWITPLTLHVFAIGMVAALGADAFVLKPILGASEWLNKMVAVLTQAISELLEDSHTLMHDHSHDKDCGHDHHGERGKHEHKKHDKHEHADPAADLEWLAGKAKSAAEWGYGKAATLFHRCAGHAIPEEMPEPKPEEISIRIMP